MRIVVLLRSPRADLDSEARLEGLGPCDRAALETALLLAMEDATTRITALTAGPASDEKSLVEALHRGAHEAVCVWCPEVEQRAEQDVSVTPRLLAAALTQIGADLVLAGTHSGDKASGTTGPAVAHVLGLPHLTQVSAVEQLEQPMRIKATQRREGGNMADTLQLPALLAVSRAPERKATPAATPANTTVRRLTCEALAFDPGDAIGLPPPVAVQPATAGATMLADATELADRLQALLR